MKLLIPVIQHNPFYYANYELLRRSYFFSQALVSNLLSSFSSASWPIFSAKSKTVLTTQFSFCQVARNRRKLNVGFRVKRSIGRSWTAKSAKSSVHLWALHPSVQWKSSYLHRKNYSSLLGTPRASTSSLRSSTFFECFLVGGGSHKVSRPSVINSLPLSVQARQRLAAFTSYVTVLRNTKVYRSANATYKMTKRNPYSLLSITVPSARVAPSLAQRFLRAFQRQSLIQREKSRLSSTLRVQSSTLRLKPQLSVRWSAWAKSRLSKVQINWTESAKVTARNLTSRVAVNSNALWRSSSAYSRLNFTRNALSILTPLSRFSSQRSRATASYTPSSPTFYRRRRWRNHLRYGVRNSNQKGSKVNYLSTRPGSFRVLLSTQPRLSLINRKRRRPLNSRPKLYSVIYSYFMYPKRFTLHSVSLPKRGLLCFSARRGSSYRLFIRALGRRRSMLMGAPRRVQKKNKLFKRKSFSFGSIFSRHSSSESRSLPTWFFSGTSNRPSPLVSSCYYPNLENGFKETYYRKSLSLFSSFDYWLSKPQSKSSYGSFQSPYLRSFHCLPQNAPHKIPTLSKIKNTIPRFYPRYTFTFSASPFFFLNYSLISLTRTSDVVEVVNPRSSQPTYLVFPDSDSVKATIFRRLNRQKSLFQNRRELLTTFYKRYNKKKSQGFLLSGPQGILTQNLASSFSGLQRSPLFIGNDTPLYGIHRLNGLMRRERLPSVTPRIRRIRFKPGYGRIWRAARKSIKEILNISVRYQYRLTPKLQRLYYRNRQSSQVYSSLTLGFALLAGRFAFDRKTIYDLLSSSNVFLNGNVCRNLTVQLFVNDFIQLLVNAKFYLVLRLLRAGMLARRYRLNRIFYRKVTSINYKKYYKTPKMSRNLPNVFFDLQYLHGDIPKYFEVDYFSLSMFIVQDQIDGDNWLPRQSFIHNPLTLNMYNWKYIT